MSKVTHIKGAKSTLQGLREVDPATHTALEQLLATKSITQSICDWNAARYDQEANHELTVSLLREEVLETLKAFAEGERVEVLDGYADIFFVAIGALWKIGLAAAHIDQLLDTINKGNALIPSPQVALMWYEDEASIYVLAMVALAALNRLEYLLSNDELALDVIRAICNSNDTKAVKKTASNVKANVVKGDNYVAPTTDLIEILERSDNASK